MSFRCCSCEAAPAIVAIRDRKKQPRPLCESCFEAHCAGVFAVRVAFAAALVGGLGWGAISFVRWVLS